MGDFNINLLKYELHKESRDFLNNMTSCLFTPFILQPTRLSSETLIDNIFFNSLEFSSYSGNLLIEIFDHLLQFIIFEVFLKEKRIPEINLYMILKSFNHTSVKFQAFLSNFKNLPFATFFTGDFNAHSQFWWPDGDMNPEGMEIENLFTALCLSQIISGTN